MCLRESMSESLSESIPRVRSYAHRNARPKFLVPIGPNDRKYDHLIVDYVSMGENKSVVVYRLALQYCETPCGAINGRLISAMSSSVGTGGIPFFFTDKVRSALFCFIFKDILLEIQLPALVYSGTFSFCCLNGYPERLKVQVMS